MTQDRNAASEWDIGSSAFNNFRKTGSMLAEIVFGCYIMLWVFLRPVIDDNNYNMNCDEIALVRLNDRREEI